MSEPILATKLHIPAPRPKAVPRPRLIQRLNEGLHHKLTLISAPAGFGKTTLVSEWIAGSKQPAAWLSLDAGDSDPTRFLAYLVAVCPGPGRQAFVVGDVCLVVDDIGQAGRRRNEIEGRRSRPTKR